MKLCVYIQSFLGYLNHSSLQQYLKITVYQLVQQYGLDSIIYIKYFGLIIIFLACKWQYGSQ